MSESEGVEDEPGRLEGAIRTVTPYYRGRRDAEMDIIGWGYFLGMLILLIPLLPFILVVWLISKLIENGASRSP